MNAFSDTQYGIGYWFRNNGGSWYLQSGGGAINPLNIKQGDILHLRLDREEGKIGLWVNDDEESKQEGTFE